MKSKYMIIVSDIKEDITNGKFKQGDKIYSESALKEKYNVSTATVVRALQELVQEDVLTRVQGKGTFVSKSIHNRKVTFNEYCKFPDHSRNNLNGLKGINYVSSEVISVEIIENEMIAKALEIDGKEKMYEVVRLRKNDGRPWHLQKNYMSVKMVKSLGIVLDENITSISELIRNEAGINTDLENMKETIRVIARSESEIADLLQVKQDFPLFHIERTTYLSGEKPLEYIVSYARSDVYYLEIEQSSVS